MGAVYRRLAAENRSALLGRTLPKMGGEDNDIGFWKMQRIVKKKLKSSPERPIEVSNSGAL